MITRLIVVDPDRSCTSWWSATTALKNIKEIEFSPGINVLWAPNGSGKSTILTTMARMLHCEQGGSIKYTNCSVSNLRGQTSLGDFMDGVYPEHDGQVIYAAPEKVFGLIGGGFDDDFFDAGFKETMARDSSGNNVLRRLTPALMVALCGSVSLPKNKHKTKLPENMAARAMGTLSQTIATVLLDEPDLSLDIPRQQKFFANMPVDLKAQVIMATHSPFALNIPGAKYHDLVPGYLEECRNACRALHSRL